MAERFAIYYAPERTSALWRLSAEWLGRDAAAETFLKQPRFKKIPEEEFVEATRSPRRYGFHATLKPPMRLAAGVDRARLEAVARALSARLKAAPVGKLELKLIDGFLALVPERQKPALTELAADCVDYFEPLRAPLEVEERLVRMSAGLNPQQVQMLDQYGYPYVKDQFRMHLTLTGRLEVSQQKIFTAAAQKWFAPALDKTYALNAISIYHEAEAGKPFVRIGDFPLFGDA